MSGSVRPVTDERDGLLTYLAQQRYVLRLAACTASPTIKHAVPSRSLLSVGGLIKHVARRNRAGWTPCCSAIRGLSNEEMEAAYEDEFRLGPNETLAGVLATYDDVRPRPKRSSPGSGSRSAGAGAT